jgi:DNA-binding transcriptional ArsR family regulator
VAVALLTRQQAAEVLGVSERSLGRHVDALTEMGQTTTIGRRVKYRRAGLEAAWLRVAHPQPANVAKLEAIARQAADDAHQAEDDDAGDDVPSWHVSKARREAALAIKAELEVQRMQGQLVSVEQVGRDWFESCRQARDSLLRLAIILPPELKHCNGDLGQMNILLHQKITEVLTQLSEEGVRRLDETTRREIREAAK